MRIYRGKGYLVIRIGDLALGYGARNLPDDIREQIDRSRRSAGV